MNQRRTIHPVKRVPRSESRKLGLLGAGIELVSQAPILLESIPSGAMDGNPAGLVELGLTNLQEALGQINILPIQTDCLSQTQSRDGQQTEQGRVGSGSQPFRRRDLLGGLD